MALPDDVVTGLRRTMRAAMAQVIVGGRPKGAAFFIGDRHLLTCQHVVVGEEPIEIRQLGMGRPVRAARVIESSPVEELDLAVLEVDPATDDAAPVSVLLRDRLDLGRHEVAGFPREEGAESAFEMYTVDAHEREAVDGTAQLLSIEGGKQITFGMSGGPVLSLESGAVTAVTRVSKDPKGILGGSAVPISRGALALDTVAALLKEPERSIIGWRNVLGRERWQQLGRVWDMRARMDLTLGGALNRWSVQTDAPGADKQFITGSDLGEEITEAMFRWAQRRRATLDDEVALLGRLLARALLPAPVVAELGRLSQEDQVLIRLHFEPASGLADVPWELSALPREADRSGSTDIKYLAADERFRFVRVAEGGSLEPAPPPSAEPVNVLGVVGLPSEWKQQPVYRDDREYESPTVDGIRNRLRDHITAKSTTLVPYMLGDEGNAFPEQSVVKNLLASGDFRVFHYIGVGRIRGNRPAELSFIDEDQGIASWATAADVFSAAAQGNVSLVVLEFAPAPAGLEGDPITPSSLDGLLAGGISALVYTRFPVDSTQYLKFNRMLYSELAGGETVETAVQRARNKVLLDNTLSNAALFGWFTLMTGEQSDIRLVHPAPAAERHGTHQPLDARGPAGGGGPSRRPSADGYTPVGDR